MVDAEKPSPPGSKEVRIDSPTVQNIPLTYVNHVIVHGSENEIFLTLFQVAPPVVVTEQELAVITSVPANCIGRVVLTWPKALELWGILGNKLRERADREQAATGSAQSETKDK